MRFVKVVAHRFGPLVDATLELKPGLNVICGPNEAGKSTWHAAIYAALCGIRRGRGRQAKEDQCFDDRHRPWDGEGWHVSGEIILADGRSIELYHDLDGRVDSRATDAVLGEDVSYEIINDGAPDGSVWLGLDRRAFLATACVRQAEVALVVDEPALLQEHLQRAAATAGADETAARALERLKVYQSEYVGLDRANSTKPLRAAKNQIQDCRTAVDSAKARHRQFEALVESAEERKAEARRTRNRLEQARAAAVVALADAAEVKVIRARELAAEFPDGKGPQREDDEPIERRARAALRAWESRPELEDLEGVPADELETQLRALPEMPDGDLAPAVAVEEAYSAWTAARSDLRAAREGEPEAPAAPETMLTEPELRELAHELDREPTALSEAVQGALRSAEAELDVARSVVGYGLLTVGATAALLGLAGFLMNVLSGAVLAAAMVVGGTGLSAGWWMISANAARKKELRARLEELRRRRAGHEQELQEFRQRRQLAVNKLQQDGIEPKSEAVRRVANQVGSAESRRQVYQQWKSRFDSVRQAFDDASVLLRGALSERGIRAEGDIERAWSAYREACRARAGQSELASRRPYLEEQVESRKQMERRHAQDREAVSRAQQTLWAVAAECGADAVNDADQACAAVQRWLQMRDAGLKRHGNRVGLWQQLQSLLDGATVEELELAAAEARRKAIELVGGLRRDGLEPLVGDVDALEEAHEAASRQANLAEGAVRQATEGRLDLCDAEARLASAERELHRVERLGDTLQRTREFLEQAQTRVQRDIAPRLSAEIEGRLPGVTQGRYTEVRVRPDDLQVRVRDGAHQWRRADQLSHGTQEQIYLLLRATMARILPKKGETCPLILDDVTVHTDEVRTVAVLDVLHELSSEQQVIVFSQEQEVLSWAENRLGERDQLLRLPGPSSSPEHSTG